MQLRPFRPRRDSSAQPEVGGSTAAAGDGATAESTTNGSGSVLDAASHGNSVPEDLHPPPEAESELPDSAVNDPSPAPAAARVVVPRWIQLVLLPLAILALWELARAAGSILLVLFAAAVIALILNPLAKFLQRALPRVLAIVLSYVIVTVLFLLVVAILSEPVTDQVSRFANNLPYYTTKANQELTSIQSWFNRHGFHVHIVKQGSTALQSLEKKLEKSSGSIVSVSKDVLGKLLTLGVDLILTFVLSVYFLVYARSIGELARRWMPSGDGTPEDDYPLLIQRAVSGYVRGQLLFSFVMGTSAALLLWLLGIAGVFEDGSKYAVFFGLFYALMELIPYIGPIIGPIPPVLVALFTHPLSAVWVVLVFIGLQQLEGHVVAPQIFRISLRINPILVILALLIGYQIFGIAGALLALPIATVIRQTILYLRGHLVLEPWSTQPPPV